MAYTNAQNVRDLLGVDIDTASDAILEEFIDYAGMYVRSLIQVRILDGATSGNIDSSNTTFSTEFAFYADITGDTMITTSDFKVYGWAKDYEDDPFKKVELTVSTFDPVRGKIKLASAPSQSTYGRITVDYSYYTKRIDWKLLALVTAWKAAELWVKREEYLVPYEWKVGTKTIKQKEPWKYFEIEVNRLIDKIRSLPMDKVTYAKLVFPPRGPAGPEVDSTAAHEIKTKSKYTKDIY